MFRCQLKLYLKSLKVRHHLIAFEKIVTLTLYYDNCYLSFWSLSRCGQVRLAFTLLTKRGI